MRRSKFEISLAVLKALAISERPVGITRLTVKAKVNYAVLKPLLDDMIEKDLVEKVNLKNGGLGFSVTSLGQVALNQYKQPIQPVQHISKEMTTDIVNSDWHILL